MASWSPRWGPDRQGVAAWLVIVGQGPVSGVFAVAGGNSVYSMTAARLVCHTLASRVTM